MEYFSCSFLKSVRDFTIEIKKVLIYNISARKFGIGFIHIAKSFSVIVTCFRVNGVNQNIKPGK